ncbi:uncharacterized protein [Dysidea avara]|uniref:uncharacterized protein isoform X2 n=1 Tax=Dysidea avara TaxID=196820 RepID=UPI0033344638
MNLSNPQQIGNPGKSPALRYELMLKEESAKSGSKGITTERIALCFEILDDLLPQLGVFQRLMKMIRDEMFAAVYSTDYTVGRRGDSSGRKSSPLQHIPHFVATRHHLELHNEKVKQLEAVNDSLRQELSTSNNELSKCSSALETYREKLTDKEDELDTINRSLQHKNLDIDKLCKTINQQQRAQERLKQEAGFKMSSLQSSLQDLSQQAAELKRFKDVHDGLQAAFSKSNDKPQNGKHSIATQRNHLRHSLRSSKILYNQLLEIQNKSIDEYEQYMNSHIDELSDIDNLDAHVEIIRYQDQFKKSIGEVNEEPHTQISLTQTHIDKLQQRLDQLDKLHSSGEGLQSAVSNSAHPANPLVPQEQILSKYAAMISTSPNKGKSFYPHRDAITCDSCGEKVVICPHRSFNKEIILPLPLHTTHIMISRPYCRESPKPALPGTLKQALSVAATRGRLKSIPSYRSVEPDMSKIWQHFRQEFPDTVRKLPRQLAEGDVVMLIEQLYGSLLMDDDLAAEDDNPQSLMDCLYSFMQDRYSVPDVMQLATFDLLSGVERCCTHNKTIQLFASQLCGKVDGTCFRYSLTMATFVTKLQLDSIDDFRQFVSIVYPFLQEDDVDQLSMDFVAYSENKCSQQMVLDYIIYLILREKEPRVVEIESQLLEFPATRTGSFTLFEFIEASDKLVSLSSDQLRHHLYNQSLAGEGVDKQSLPSSKTAQIIAYLLVQQHYQSIVVKLEKCYLGQQQKHEDHVMQHFPSFSTLVTVKGMASRLKKSLWPSGIFCLSS